MSERASSSVVCIMNIGWKRRPHSNEPVFCGPQVRNGWRERYRFTAAEDLRPGNCFWNAVWHAAKTVNAVC